MVTLKLNVDDFVEMLSDRALWWDHQIGAADADVYSEYFLEAGPDMYDGATITQTISEIVDNFIINDTSCIRKDDFLKEYDYNSIDDAWDDGKILYESVDGKYFIVDDTF